MCNNPTKNSKEGLITVGGKEDKSGETMQNEAQRGMKMKNMEENINEIEDTARKPKKASKLERRK